MKINHQIRLLSDSYYALNLKRVYKRKIQYVLKNNSEIRKIKFSKQQVNTIKDFWEQYKIKPNLDWFRAYTYASGEFSHLFIPDDIFFLYIEPTLNNMFFSKAFAEKNAYDRIFKQIKTPKTVLRRIHNNFYDADYQHLEDKHQIISVLKKHSGEVLIKPGIEDGGGKNIQKINVADIAKAFNKKDSENFYLRYSKDYIIQEIVNQHPAISEIYDKSLNCIRIISLRLNDEIIILAGVIKFGNNGSFLDGQKQGGVNCGINEYGHVKATAFNDRRFQVFKSHPYTGRKFEGLVIPSYDELRNKVKELHKGLLHQDIASWDLSIDSDENPILIETNLSNQAIALQQANNGPVFGQNTEKVLNNVFSNPVKKTYIRIA